MPANAAQPPGRRLLHKREIVCEGYEREDGLFDVEARLLDTKSYAVGGASGGALRQAGEAIHLMSVTLTLDDTFTIVCAAARTLQGPYPDCSGINDAYGRLAGLRIESGFNGRVRRLFRGAAGCTHLTELFGPLATTAIQTIRGAIRLRQPVIGPGAREQDTRSLPLLLDTCWGLRRGSPAARARWGDAAADAPRTPLAEPLP